MPVVYNGVPGTGEGDLFQGLKLWIGQRVPQRARWIDLVKGNGGEIVKLEKNADMMISDNVKVAGNIPIVGSYMWRWIDDSVKNGFLQDKDDYLIGRREGSEREPVNARPIKAGRTPFTPRDDLILTKYIMAEERMGSALSGNAIYKTLERRHSQHTWQSWRDRWVKILRDKPRPDISDEDIQAEIDQHHGAIPQPTPGSARAARQPPVSQSTAPSLQQSSTQRKLAPPLDSSPSAAARTGSRPLGPKGKVPFTKAEDHLLLEYIEYLRHKNRADGLEENTNLSGNAIYQDFADKHPAHSWHSWRDRWVRHLSLLEAVDDAGPDKASNADYGEARHLYQQQLPQPLVNGDIETRAAGGAPESTRKPSSPREQSNPRSDEQRLQRQLRARREAQAALSIEKNWRGHAMRRDMARLETAVVPLQSAMRGFVARMRLTALAKARRLDRKSEEADTALEDEEYETATDEPRGEDVSAREMLPNDHESRERFYKDLEIVSGFIGAEIDNQPNINGQRIDLWDLYRLAVQQNCDLDTRDWKLVTERLGFEPAAVYKVQACYLQNLVEFEQQMKMFEGNDDMDEEAVEEGEEEEEEARNGRRAVAAEIRHPTSDFATAPKEMVADPSSPVYRSSPPIVGSKRSLEHTNLLKSDSGYPSSGPRKRRRVDRNSVIPQTPDDKLGAPNVTAHDPGMQDKSSPLKSKALRSGDAVEISSDDESGKSDGGVMKSIEEEDELPVRTRPSKQRFIEPETQDWRISQDPFPMDVFDDDPSPSQQLLTESDAFKSPQQVVPSNRSPVAKTHPSRPAEEVSERLRGSRTRELRSNPGRAAKPVTLTSSLRAPVTGGVKKRTLPNTYQRKAASAVPDYSTTAVLAEQSNRKSPAHSKGKIMARPISTVPARAMNGGTSRSTRSNAYTSTPILRNPTEGPSVASHFATGEDVIVSEESEKWDEAHVEAQIRHFEALGYNDKHISQAMKAGTMSRGPIITALESLHNGRGIPENVAGIWTARDDKSLLMIRKYEQQVGKGKTIAGKMDNKMRVLAWNLEKKHGTQGVEDRWNFMQLMGKAEGI